MSAMLCAFFWEGSIMPILVIKLPFYLLLQFCTTSENSGSSEELEMYEGPVPRGGRVLWGWGYAIPLILCDTTYFPTDKLSVSFSRSSGPGGQNVNKGSVAEWSKALVLGTSHRSGVGSNPTAARLFFFHSSFFHTTFST